MKIEDIELRELFLETLCTASKKCASDANDGDYLLPGIASDRPITLHAYQAGGGGLLSTIAILYEQHGLEELARVARDLSVALQDEKLLGAEEKGTVTRILDYVYPVV